jgi:hypothetical protein
MYSLEDPEVADTDGSGLPTTTVKAVVLGLVLSVVERGADAFAEAVRVTRRGGCVRVFDKVFAVPRLVLNAIVVWHTRYMGLVVDELQTMGMRIDPEDVERLSPLVHHHIHLSTAATHSRCLTSDAWTAATVA